MSDLQEMNVKPRQKQGLMTVLLEDHVSRTSLQPLLKKKTEKKNIQFK